SLTDREQRLEVVLGENLEGDHRVGAADPDELGDVSRHHLGELLVLTHAEDRDEVPLAGDRVRLGHARDVGQLSAQRGQGRVVGVDQDVGVGHVECVWPGSSTTTSERVEDSTSDLKASASVSSAGKVLKWHGITVFAPTKPAASTASVRSIV